MNSFSLNGDGLSTTDLNSGFGSTSAPTRDTGTAGNYNNRKQTNYSTNMWKNATNTLKISIVTHVYF
jgi:hypothetical protein